MGYALTGDMGYTFDDRLDVGYVQVRASQR